ncbi:MAG: MOSC domain-containing protein, partial [Acidimicrobiales bacterium]
PWAGSRVSGTGCGEVASLRRYPVKSMLGEQPGEIWAGPGGVLGDRALALVDADTAMVASAKNPRKWEALLGCRASYSRAPEPGSPLPAVAVLLPDGTVLDPCAPGSAELISGVVGRRVEVAARRPPSATIEREWPDVERMAPERVLAEARAGAARGEPAVTTSHLGGGAGSFVDQGQLHLITTSALAALAAAHPGGSFDPARFRPNLVLSLPGSGGADGSGDAEAGFVEDGWLGRRLQIGDDVVIEVVQPVPRCIVPTLAQPGLSRDVGILRAVAAEHRVEIPGRGTYACAGVYADVVRPGRLRVGDAVALL